MGGKVNSGNITKSAGWVWQLWGLQTAQRSVSATGNLNWPGLDLCFPYAAFPPLRFFSRPFVVLKVEQFNNKVSRFEVDILYRWRENGSNFVQAFRVGDVGSASSFVYTIFRILGSHLCCKKWLYYSEPLKNVQNRETQYEFQCPLLCTLLGKIWTQSSLPISTCTPFLKCAWVLCVVSPPPHSYQIPRDLRSKLSSLLQTIDDHTSSGVLFSPCLLV